MTLHDLLNKFTKTTFVVIKNVLPPFIIKLLKLCFGNKGFNKLAGKITARHYQPKWNKLNFWPFQNVSIFVDPSGPFSKMISGDYDSQLFKVLKGVDLKNKVVLDIGAHIGFDTLAFASLVDGGGLVYAFEPNIYNLERLKMNVEENKELVNRIKIIDKAISDENGSEDFIFSDNIESGTSSGSFIESADTIWEKSIYEENIGFKRIKIKTTNLNSLINDFGDKKVGLLKIDVEGAENLIFKGGKDFINKFRPTILLEVHSIFNGLKVADYLNRLSYSIEILNEESDGRCFVLAKPLNE